MTQTLKCIGWVFAGVGIVAGGAVSILTVSFLLFWAGTATGLALGYSKEIGPIFMIGYLMLGAGIAIGVGLCIENRR